MITLHLLRGKEIVVNAEQIKFIESTPDTLISLVHNNEKFMVSETVDEVVQRVVEYKRKWLWSPPEVKK